MSNGRFLKDSIYRFRTLQLATATYVPTVAKCSRGSHASAGHVNL